MLNTKTVQARRLRYVGALFTVTDIFMYFISVKSSLHTQCIRLFIDEKLTTLFCFPDIMNEKYITFSLLYTFY